MKGSFRPGLSSSERARVTSIIVASRVSDELYSCAAASKKEVCGGLYGAVEGTSVLVRALRICANQAGDRHEFTLNLDELFASGSPVEQRLGIFSFASAERTSTQRV